MGVSRREALDKGVESECLVANKLLTNGWAILARNWRGGRGELDIVAEKGGCLRFIEVKSRPTFAAGIDSITSVKKRRLLSAGESWLLRYGEPQKDVSFILAVVVGNTADNRIEWLDDPFDGH